MSFTTLDTTNFPLYAVDVLDGNYFLIAGGGGSARTGVPNCLCIYKLGRDNKNVKASMVYKFDAGQRAIMNCAVHPTSNVLAVGMDNKCQILEVISKEEVQNITQPQGKNKEKIIKKKVQTFEIKERQSATTVDDSNVKDEDDLGFQKVVKFTADGKHIVTGGSDGHVRVLKYPSLECLHDVTAHKTDVDDLDIHPNCRQFVTVSRDTTAYVWRLEEGKKEFQLYFSGDREEGFFRVRACRFGTDEKKNVNLYTIHVPSKFNRNKPTPSYLVKWDCQKWVPALSQPAGFEPVTQMAISPDGVYIGVGTSDGGISIYLSWNLMSIAKLQEVHNIFVTGLHFLPQSKLINDDLNNEVALLSISADNACKVTTVANKGVYSVWWVLGGFILLLYLTFMTLAFLGFDF
ncbi:prolactin regulatory element-binding protein [Exaiptasia diaphana]|uniref:Prolactin regulatory element-binding protein n=1 Tax=Exaiptasia diaphana TaxID=2652724 RepID=A0A913XFL2_EXADI|nr:prolactin regulatory element-binding protein [Exaiptasia diaphana]KXJ12602.1 Prolactin regulatory element-binding protein [Exaiptasia diaphana]